MRWLFTLLCCSLLSLGYAQKPLKLPIKDYHSWLQSHLTTLTMGSGKDSVLAHMGGVQPIRVRGFGVKDEFPSPFRSEQFTLGDGQRCEIIWYKVWEKEKAFRYAYTFTPLILRDDQLVGQGVNFAQTFALKEGFKLEMP
jgi:hypothetical protein